MLICQKPEGVHGQRKVGNPWSRIWVSGSTSNYWATCIWTTSWIPRFQFIHFVLVCNNFSHQELTSLILKFVLSFLIHQKQD